MFTKHQRSNVRRNKFTTTGTGKKVNVDLAGGRNSHGSRKIAPEADYPEASSSRAPQPRLVPPLEFDGQSLETAARAGQVSLPDDDGAVSYEQRMRAMRRHFASLKPKTIAETESVTAANAQPVTGIRNESTHTAEAQIDAETKLSDLPSNPITSDTAIGPKGAMSNSRAGQHNPLEPSSSIDPKAAPKSKNTSKKLALQSTSKRSAASQCMKWWVVRHAILFTIFDTTSRAVTCAPDAVKAPFGDGWVGSLVSLLAANVLLPLLCGLAHEIVILLDEKWYP
ncbi:hypothetical protein B0A55_05823 [Friedmanniomyces simplex]|uniref:Uncharacterized protein n=1 Tax=Friedmanniomyces simplex TaxID=329884 RepID=A0A4V6WL01_9PEZI|nr:hypothetical protein B0A55_05823 [Friedmanniomyces simplex]